MSRFDETEAAVLLRLRALKAKPEVTISLLDLGLSLDAAGYSQQDVREVL
jgi:hypothetical protein